MMRKIEDIENENINRFSKKILKKKNEAGELSDLLSNKYIKQVQDDNLSKSIESIISTLKKIPEDAENLALILNREL